MDRPTHSARDTRGRTPDTEQHAGQHVERQDMYARIAREIVAVIEAGPGRSKLPWHHDGSDLARPMNLVSRKRYRAINVLALRVAAMKSGCTSSVWGTYRQFMEAGGQVRKGERATTVVFWKQFRNGDAEAAPQRRRSAAAPAQARANRPAAPRA